MLIHTHISSFYVYQTIFSFLDQVLSGTALSQAERCPLNEKVQFTGPTVLFYNVAPMSENM